MDCVFGCIEAPNWKQTFESEQMCMACGQLDRKY